MNQSGVQALRIPLRLRVHAHAHVCTLRCLRQMHLRLKGAKKQRHDVNSPVCY